MSHDTVHPTSKTCCNAICLALLLATSGCALFSPRQNYYYRPTIADRAMESKIILNGSVTEKPKASPPAANTVPAPDTAGITITDVDVYTFMNDLKQAWRERSQAARVGGAMAGVGAVGLSAAATTAAATHGGTTAGNTVPILTGIGTFLTELLGLTDPAGRELAYKDGIKLLLEAEVEYCQNLMEDLSECKVRGDRLTSAGQTLLERTNAALAVVDKALEGRIPTKEQVERATAEIKKTTTSIATDTTSLRMQPGDKKTITVVRGKNLTYSSEDEHIATIADKDGKGKTFEVTADSSADCKSTQIDFSNNANEVQSVAVRVESLADFKIASPSEIAALESATTRVPLTIQGCKLKTVRSDNTKVALANLIDPQTMEITGIKAGETTVQLSNTFDRTASIKVKVSMAPVPYSKQPSRDLEKAKALQAWLNGFNDVTEKLIIDGIPGDKTSDAYLKVTGQRLPGDPRS